MSNTHKYRLFREECVKDILILYLYTTPAYVGPIGSGVLWPYNNHISSFPVKYTFTSKIRLPVTFHEPTDGKELFSKTSNDIPTLCISLSSDS